MAIRPESDDAIREHLPLNPKTAVILLALSEGSAHGYEIRKRAEANSGGTVRLDAGSLYRTLGQLLDRGLIEEAPERPTPRADDPRRRYYLLTPLGENVLRAEVMRLSDMVDRARANALLPSPGGSV